MSDLSLFYFFKTKMIDPSIEFHGNLQNSIATMFSLTVSDTLRNSVKIGPIIFKYSRDPRVCNLEYEMLCPGRTISDVIVKVENEFPVIFVAVPREDEGYDISLEYYERSFGHV